jgi:hypothetical protein
MKKIVTALTLFFLTFSISNSFAQSKTNLIKTDAIQNVSAKQDSAQLKQAEINAFVEQVVKNTPVTEFQQWCYKKMTAEKYDEFTEVYQLFLQQKFEEWVQQKKK